MPQRAHKGWKLDVSAVKVIIKWWYNVHSTTPTLDSQKNNKSKKKISSNILHTY